MLKQKKHMCKTIARKNLTKKKLWTFEWLKMNHIFISPYHNHFRVNFKKKILNMYIINLFKLDIFRIGFSVHYPLCDSPLN